MTLARPRGVRYVLLLLSASLAACAGSVRPLPEPTPRTTAQPRQPAVSAAGTSTRRDTAAAQTARADSADAGPGEPATVLPSIIRRGGIVHAGSPERRSGRNDEADQPVRIALALSQALVRLGSTGGMSLGAAGSELPVRTLPPGDGYLIQLRGTRIELSSGGEGSQLLPPGATVVLRPSAEGSALTFNAHRYRGEILVVALGGGLAVVNRLPMEEYLRGVVPLEIGSDRTGREEAAVAAQAVAARSYAYTRLESSRPYDMLATVADQMYGGMDAERGVADDAIEATRGMVLRYNGKVVNAPYHANSGGITAAASEVWRSADEPYLVPVSDRIPGTDRFYCEDSPKFSWTRTLDRAALSAMLDRYLPQYGGAPPGGVGHVRSISEIGRTPSGRVAGLSFATDRGRFTVRGNDIRFVLRSAAGELLPSTLFSLETATDDNGRVMAVTIHGTGNGHGVGMDQWGAIARARAGQSYVTILQTYYPGTNVGPVI